MALGPHGPKGSRGGLSLNALNAVIGTSIAATGRILFVDDDEHLLTGIRRRLRRRFDVETAAGPQRGLELLTAEPDFAVVVADMNMPGMTGAEFLGHVQQLRPDAIRMMLTGNADIDTAIAAVNSGNIFRFLQKPLPPELLEQALLAGLEQRELVASQRRAAVAEQTLHAKSQFLATVSHELRTPLTVIRSAVEILHHFSADEPEAVRAEFLATIGTSVDRLDRMLGQVLSIAELDAVEARPLDAQPFDLAAVLRESVARADADAGQGRPATEILAGPAPLPCRGRASAIASALLQVLVNAHRYSPAVTPVQVAVQREAAAARIEITDRGPGIDPAIAHRLFEPFVQCADVLVDKPPGLGVGLSIARRVMQLHGGSITIAGRAGGGTVCTIHMPLGENEEGRP
jgi:signal transduction histidine kinase